LKRKTKEETIMNADKIWNSKKGYVDAGPATGKEGTGNPNAVDPKKIDTHTKGPDWDNAKGYVNNGPKGE
jgi:hypothetical protein